jgi:sugar lactone lactonase YvrE
MDQVFRIAEIEQSQAAGERIVGLFRYDGSERGKRGPTLLLVADIDSTLYAYEQLLDTLNEAAEQTRRLLAAYEGDPMARFEKLVQRLNEAVATFVEREPTAIAWNRVNLFLLEFHEGLLCVAGTGRLSNMFLQKQTDGGWKGFDLFGSLEQPSEIDPKKPFASFICGDLKPGDVLFAGTQNFDALRGQLKIAESLKTLPPVTAALEIKQELERRELNDDFAGLVAWLSPLTKEEKIEVVEEAGKSTRSVEKQRANERDAEGVLSPAIRPSKPAATLFGMFADISSKLKRRHSKYSDQVAIAGMRNTGAGHGTTLTVKRKRQLMIGGGILLIILIGAIWFQRDQKAKAEQAFWNTVYDQAVDRKTQAEANIVYNNDNRARQLIDEGRELVDGLDEKTTERKDAKQMLQSEFEDIATKLRHEVTIEEPPEITTASLGAPDDSITTVAAANGGVYAADTNARQLIEVKPATRETTRHDFPQSMGRVIASWPGASGIYLLDDQRKLFVFNETNASFAQIAWGASQVSSTSAFAVYGRRFYMLDTQSNMVWRYAPLGNGIAQETAYLKQNSTELANATAIAVDQNVWLAFRDGAIKRYSQGTEDGFAQPPVDPALTNISAMWTDDVSNLFIVTDKVGKRVLVFRKDGRLIVQYTSPALTGPTSVHADRDAKKIYVTDNNKVYQFDLPNP